MSQPNVPRWLEQARAILADAHGTAAVAEVVTVTIRNASGKRVSFTLPAKFADVEPRRPPLEGAVLEVLASADKPLTAPLLAKLAGYRCNSHFRAALAALDREGLVRRTPDGYTRGQGKA
jgi:hypothetical protein